MANASPITNCWGSAQTKVLRPDEFMVFAGREGAAYNHHHQVTSLDETLFATWSSADVHEDAPGQHMMIATSDNYGETWSEARPLVDRLPGEFGEAVVTSEGIHVHDGRLVAYYGFYDYTELGHELLYEQTTGINGKADPSVRWHRETYTGILASDDGGDTWEPAGGIDRFVPNLAPHRLADGRQEIPRNMWFPWTDDLAGIDGWTVAGIPRLPADYFDDPEGFWIGKQVRGDDSPCCEGSCFQTDDGVVHMMLRTEGDHLAVTESSDNGVTYSEPSITSFTDCHSRFHFGRLPDGRFFGTSCPAPGSLRTPLVLAASDDGVRFDRHYVLGDEADSRPRGVGIQKFGRYGYPSYHVAGDTMFVIHSVAKEDIAILRLPLAALD